MRVYSFIVGLLIILMSWGQSYYVNYLIPLGVIAIIGSIINILVVKKRMSNTFYRIILSASVLFIAMEILWFIFDKISLFVIAQFSFVIVGFVLFAFGLGIHTKMQPQIKMVTVRIVKWIPVIILLSISSLLIILTATPKPFAFIVETITGNGNSFEANAPSETVNFDDNYQLTNNIQYGEEYPRSFLDILTPVGEFNENRPTYFYVHGGGFIGGDKMKGDPNVPVNEDFMGYHFKIMLDHGYNVVSINYAFAFAPEYEHPTPIKQVSEAVRFLQENGQQYGINMDDVVFAGGSAGGFIASAFTSIQANPAYAKETGIDPVINLENIKALVLEVPALDTTRASKTVEEDPFSDYTFGQSLAAYLGTSLVSNDVNVNLITKLTSDMPPTFITDGNTGSFADQAIDYYNRLNELGVKANLYIPDINESVEVHGYMSNIDTKATQMYVEKRFEFLDSLD